MRYRSRNEPVEFHGVAGSPQHREESIGGSGYRLGTTTIGCAWQGSSRLLHIAQRLELASGLGGRRGGLGSGSPGGAEPEEPHGCRV